MIEMGIFCSIAKESSLILPNIPPVTSDVVEVPIEFLIFFNSIDLARHLPYYNFLGKH